MAYQRVTGEERRLVYSWRRAGCGVREIARRLGRAASSISRELLRNRGQQGYRPKQAHWKATEKSKRPGPRRFTAEVRPEAEARLKEGWTPEIIGQRARLEGRAWVCKETIDKHIGVVVARGVDAARGVSYRVCAQRGIEWAGLAEPLNVAWVQETPLKGPRAGQTEEFWVLTTDATLTAAEMREVAHARWGIENLGFQATNAQVGSKLGYVRNARVKETLLLLWSWGLALLGAWQWWLSQQPAWRQWGVRKTKALIGLVLTVTALGGEVSGCGGSP